LSGEISGVITSNLRDSRQTSRVELQHYITSGSVEKLRKRLETQGRRMGSSGEAGWRRVREGTCAGHSRISAILFPNLVKGAI